MSEEKQRGNKSWGCTLMGLDPSVLNLSQSQQVWGGARVCAFLTRSQAV